jgi:hypothetical protein
MFLFRNKQDLRQRPGLLVLHYFRTRQQLLAVSVLLAHSLYKQQLIRHLQER